MRLPIAALLAAVADGTRLHGLLKRAPAARNGERFPLVIVFGGVARETSWMVGWGEKPAAWGGPKSIVTLPGGHRMVEWRAEYWRALGEFLGGLTAAQRRLEGSGTVQK